MPADVGIHFKKEDNAKPHQITPMPHPSHFVDSSAYQKGLVAMIQDDFPRTPSPVYGKEALNHAAALAAANQAAALSYEMAQASAEQLQLSQAMQALHFQPPALSQGPAPLQHHGGRMQPPMQMGHSMAYGTPQTKISMGAPPSGWTQGMLPPSLAQPPLPPQQMQQMGMQSHQYYQQPLTYAPQIYGMAPYGEAEQVQAGFYNPQPFEQQQYQQQQLVPQHQPHQSQQQPMHQHQHQHQPHQLQHPPHQPQHHQPMHQHPQHPSQHQHPQLSPGDKPKKGNRRERGHDDVPRTRLMEEFRSMKARRWEIQDLVGHMVEFSRDQEGSRLIQRKLEGCSDTEKDMVFTEVFKEALGLMTDVFGNYVIQKLFEHGLSRHRKMLACVLKGNVLSLTLQTYGCRVIQKALEVIDEDDQTMVASELDGHVLRCVLDQNGNHVIQKCIERIPPQNVIFIVQSFIGNVQNLAVHAYGCRVIQRILEYCEDHHEVISPILDEILDNVHILARDQYGNYVIQHVLINGKPIYQAAIIERLRRDSLELAQHKFASNVVEKMFHYGTQDDRNAILADLLRINADGTSALHVMMRDQYANYVVQKIIDMADDGQRRLIIDHIKPHIATLRRYTYGKHIIARIEKLTSTGKGSSIPPQCA